MICLETTTSTAHMKAAADSAGGEPRVRDAISGNWLSGFWLDGFWLALFTTPSTALIARDVSYSPQCRPGASRAAVASHAIESLFFDRIFHV
jgi:hypothetical protein